MKRHLSRRQRLVLHVSLVVLVLVGTVGAATNVPVSIATSLIPKLGPASPEPAAPHCVTDASEPHIVLAYARPFDAADAYSSASAMLRTMIPEANGYVRAAGEKFGWQTDLRVLCEVGSSTPVVLNLILPTSVSQHTTKTVAFDIITSPQVAPAAKVLAQYEGNPRPGLGGESVWPDPSNINNLREHISDDRPGPENANNRGGSVSMVYGSGSTGPYLHEMLHGMGAVQYTSPHADGTGHCWDRDVLCNAQPPAGTPPPTTTCGAVVDCHNDDYYHPEPPADNYLATHWNVGGPNNAYIHRARLPSNGSIIPTLPAGVP